MAFITTYASSPLFYPYAKTSDGECSRFLPHKRILDAASKSRSATIKSPEIERFQDFSLYLSSAPHIRHHRPTKRCGYQDGVRYAGSLLSRLHPGHLRPCHHLRPKGSCHHHGQHPQLIKHFVAYRKAVNDQCVHGFII